MTPTKTMVAVALADMANPVHHSKSAAAKWGGDWTEYMPINEWFDKSKAFMGDFRHRALRHHAEGIFECEEKFGPVLKLSTGADIPTRWIAERHVIEDCGFIPSMQDWFKAIVPVPWMNKARKLSKELEQASNQIEAKSPAEEVALCAAT